MVIWKPAETVKPKQKKKRLWIIDLFPNEVEITKKANHTDYRHVTALTNKSKFHVYKVAKGKSPDINTFKLLLKTVEERLNGKQFDTSYYAELERIMNSELFKHITRKHKQSTPTTILNNYLNFIKQEPIKTTNGYHTIKQTRRELFAENNQLRKESIRLKELLLKYGISI